MNSAASARKVKDTAVDLHNLTQKWTKLNNEGMTIIKEIANIKLSNVVKIEEGEKYDVQTLDVHDKMPVELDGLCKQSTALILKMDKIVMKMEGIIQLFKNLYELEIHQSESEEIDHDVVLFQTWTLSQFKTTTSELYSMYKKELLLKHSVIENICHTDIRSVMMFYIAAWVHQPYVEDRSSLLLDSILIETGHK